MAYAFHAAGFESVDVHMTDILEGRVKLTDFRGLVACGGFSYGDVLGAGQGWAKTILFNPRARDEFQSFLARPDRFALGVCNGCQMFAALKDIVPGATHWPMFRRNRSEQFEARWTLVEILPSKSLFFAGMAGSRLPIAVAHGEGRAVFSTPADLAALQNHSRWRCASSTRKGGVAQRYPAKSERLARGRDGTVQYRWTRDDPDAASGAHHCRHHRFMVAAEMGRQDAVVRDVRQCAHVGELSKAALYAGLVGQARALIGDERDPIANAANLCALIWHALPDLNWAGFYLFDGHELVLGPFQGKPACIRIALGKGVCGTAAQTRKTVIVKNVHEFPGHIACDTASNSEVVVPLMRETKLLGVLDLDSPKLARFDADDAAGLEKLAAIWTKAP